MICLFCFTFTVINENDMLLLNEKCHEIVDATKETIQKWSKEGTYAAFVCDQMKKLPVDHAERIQSASKILYLHYLIAFFKRSMFKRLSGSKLVKNHFPKLIHRFRTFSRRCTSSSARQSFRNVCHSKYQRTNTKTRQVRSTSSSSSSSTITK